MNLVYYYNLILISYLGFVYCEPNLICEAVIHANPNNCNKHFKIVPENVNLSMKEFGDYVDENDTSKYILGPWQRQKQNKLLTGCIKEKDKNATFLDELKYIASAYTNLKGIQDLGEINWPKGEDIFIKVVIHSKIGQHLVPDYNQKFNQDISLYFSMLSTKQDIVRLFMSVKARNYSSVECLKQDHAVIIELFYDDAIEKYKIVFSDTNGHTTINLRTKSLPLPVCHNPESFDFIETCKMMPTKIFSKPRDMDDEINTGTHKPISYLQPRPPKRIDNDDCCY